MLTKDNRTCSRRWMLQAHLAGAVMLGAGRAAAGADLSQTAVVPTKVGQVRGFRANGVYNFLGVPYGAPTSGANRFMPPRSPEPWGGVRDTFNYGPMAMQTPVVGRRGSGVVAA